MLRKISALTAAFFALAAPAHSAEEAWSGCMDNMFGDYNKAIQLCSEAISSRRLNSDDLAYAYSARGQAYYSRAVNSAVGIGKNYEVAIANYSSAIADYSIVRSLDDSRALSSSVRAIVEDAALQLWQSYSGRGRAYEDAGKIDAALADYRAAVGSVGVPLDPQGLKLSNAKLNARIAALESKLRSGGTTAEQQIPSAHEAVPSQLSGDASGGAKNVFDDLVPSSRVALVIGNSAYTQVAKLANPGNDTDLIASALHQDGFEVTLLKNADRERLINALKTFASKADAADWAVVYFAGHGIEMGGTDYLIPTDAKLLSDRDVEFEAIPVGQVLSAIDGAHMLRMVILDACRDNPYVPNMKRANGTGRNVGRGLARIEAGPGTVIVFSAKAGTIASDGDGPNSPFAAALARHLTDSGLEVGKLFRLVRDDVLAATGNAQEVFEDSSLPGKDFFFRQH
jgi:hypothetical protein